MIFFLFAKFSLASLNLPSSTSIVSIIALHCSAARDSQNVENPFDVPISKICLGDLAITNV